MRPMSRAARSLAIVAVVALSLGVIGVLVLNLGGGPAAGGPSPSASAASAVPSPDAESPAATAAGDELARLQEIQRQVRELRGLPDPNIGPVELINREQLSAEVDKILDETWSPEELRRANLTLRAMGLLDEGQDLRELTARLLDAQVAGFYDPFQKRMVVITEAGLSAEAQVYFAHEYTHALQDGAFEIFTRQDQLTDDDPIAASQALTEGDASIVMVQWAFANLAPEELLQIGSTPLPDMTGIPEWMTAQLLWPYTAGIEFLTTVSGLSIVPGGDASGGWSTVDEIYANPPISTEQVLHPDKYRAGEEPLPVEAVGLSQILGAGWQDLEPNTMGEALLDIWLTELGSSYPTSVAAAGWGGDRLAVAEGPDGEWAMAWRIAFDTAADQDEFEAALQSVDGFGGYRTPSDTELILLNASSAEILDRLAAAIGPPAG